MLRFTLTLDHADHGRLDLDAGPAEIIRWEQHSKSKITNLVNADGDVDLGLTDLAFLAYAALRRRGDKLPPFEIWADGLRDLDMVDDDPDPTSAGPSDTP